MTRQYGSGVSTDLARTEREQNAREALTSIEASMTSDGYALHVSSAAEAQYTIAIEALPGACEECLVTKDIMSSIITSTLERAGVGVTELRVEYPAVSKP